MIEQFLGELRRIREAVYVKPVILRDVFTQYGPNIVVGWIWRPRQLCSALMLLQATRSNVGYPLYLLVCVLL